MTARTRTVAGAFVAALLVASGTGQARALPTPTSYSAAVTRICAGALLFAGRHAIGTRAGAIAVSRDIRRTGLRRLALVDAIPKPRSAAGLASRWIAVERQLVRAYASAYLRIWYAVEQAQGASVLRRLVHEPDRLQRGAVALGTRLGVPDCTGGVRPSSTGSTPKGE